MNRFQELVEEFRTVVSGRGNLLDAVVPPAVFLILRRAVEFRWALLGSLAVALSMTVLRLARRQPLGYALGGLGAVLIAVLLAGWLNRAEGFFLPGILSDVIIAVLCAVSVLARRPLVAWTSRLARGWPLKWYWHARVRPAYSEVTVCWALYFFVRILIQTALFRSQATNLLAIAQLIAGWPSTIALLAVSYLYGTWRLGRLGGPSIEEFKQGVAPPWSGQRRGF